MAEATSSGSTPTGGVPSSSAAMTRHRLRIFGQSSTAWRTSSRTARIIRSSSRRRSSSPSRSMDSSIHDSAQLADGPARNPLGVALGHRLELADRVAHDDSCGWTMRWMSMPSWTSAPVTESTRNGMSSVTTWITMVRGLDQPSDSVLGL